MFLQYFISEKWDEFKFNWMTVQNSTTPARFGLSISKWCRVFRYLNCQQNNKMLTLKSSFYCIPKYNYFYHIPRKLYQRSLAVRKMGWNLRKPLIFFKSGYRKHASRFLNGSTTPLVTTLVSKIHSEIINYWYY